MTALYYVLVALWLASLASSIVHMYKDDFNKASYSVLALCLLSIGIKVVSVLIYA